MPKQTRQHLPRCAGFMISQFINGAICGAIFGKLLIRLDTAGLGSLLEGAATGAPTAIFLGQGMLLFGTLFVSVAIINLGDDPV
ncbi:MAG: hypothetical protein II336_01450 [Loktanella sp.]|nr:hypothetical protein [Loktanella sp.]